MRSWITIAIIGLLLVACAPSQVDVEHEKGFDNGESGVARGLMGIPSAFEIMGNTGYELSFSLSPLKETVNTFQSVPELSLPVFNLGGQWTSINYRVRGNDTPTWEVGNSRAWTPTWFGALYVHLSTSNNAHYGDESTNVAHPGIFLINADGSMHKAVKRDLPTGGQELRFTDMSVLKTVGEYTNYEVLGTDGSKTKYNTPMSLQRWHPEYDGSVSKIAILLPTEIEDVHGNVTSVMYYGQSPIPYKVTKERRLSNGGKKPISNAFFYLARQVQSPTVPNYVPTHYTDTTPEDHVTAIRFPGVSSQTLLAVQSDWATTFFNYSNIGARAQDNPKQYKTWLMSSAQVNGELYKFTYFYPTGESQAYIAAWNNTHSGAQKITKIELPNKTTIEYAYQLGGSSSGGQYPGISLRTVKTFEGKSFKWAFQRLGTYNAPAAHSLFGSSVALDGNWVLHPGEDGEPRRLELYLHHAFSWTDFNARHLDMSDARVGQLALHNRYKSNYTLSQLASSNANSFASDIKEQEIYGYGKYKFGLKDIVSGDGMDFTCQQEVALPSFVAKTVFGPSSKVISVSTFRNQADQKSNVQLKAFGSQNAHVDYDYYLNGPFSQIEYTTSSITPKISKDCQAWHTGYTSCTAFMDTGWDPQTVSQSGSASECFQDYVEISGGQENHRSEPTYLYELSSRKQDYLAKNLVNLVRKQTNKGKTGEILAQEETDYDYEQWAYPSASGTPGLLANDVLGRVTAIKRINLGNSSNSPITYTSYYGRTSDGLVPPGAVAETASLVSGNTYRRSRFGYVSYGATPTSGLSSIFPSSPTSTTLIDYSGNAFLVGEVALNAWDLPIWNRDENGAVTRIEYDSKGRMTKSFSPIDGTLPSLEMVYKDSYDSIPSPPRVTTIKRSAGIEQKTHAFSDGLNRVFQTQVELLNGNVMVTKTDFWKQTNLADKKYLPRVTGGNPASVLAMPSGPYTKNTYDDFGRLIKTEGFSNGASDGASSTRYGDTTSSLNLFEKELTDVNGKITKTKVDFLGRTISETLSGNRTVTHVYNAKDQHIEITHPDNLKTTFSYDGLGRLLSSTSPESGAVSFEYNLLNEVLKRTQANGTSTGSAYDYRGRVISSLDGTQLAAAYAYDSYNSTNLLSSSQQFGKGRATKVMYYRDGTSVGQEQYGYDVLGRPIEQVNDLTGLGIKRTYWTYNHVLLQDMTYETPGTTGFKLKYDYDALARPLRINEMNGNVAKALVQYEYDFMGRISTERLLPAGFGELQKNTFSRDVWGRMIGMNDPLNLGTNAFAYKLGFNDTLGIPGSVARKDNTPSVVIWNSVGQVAGAYRFTYSDQDFLIGADYLGKYGAVFQNVASWDMAAQIDNVGNITALQQNQTPAQTAITYAYNPQNRRLVKTFGGSVADFIYDNAGNLIFDSRMGNLSYINYNAANRVSKIRVHSNVPTSLTSADHEFAYDAAGLRVRADKKSLSGQLLGSTYWVRVNGKPIAEYDKNGNLQQLFLTEGTLKIPQGSTAGRAGLHFLLKDHLGSTRATVHESGDVLQLMDYSPFGIKLDRSKNYEALKVNRQFTGYHRHESDFGPTIDYANARMYDPTLGRFMRPDPVKGVEPTLTAYNYAANKPNINTDPTGMITQGNGSGDDELYNGGNLPEVTVTAKRSFKYSVRVDNTYVDAIRLPIYRPTAPIGATYLNPGRYQTPYDKQIAQQMLVNMEKQAQIEEGWEKIGKFMNENPIGISLQVAPMAIGVGELVVGARATAATVAVVEGVEATTIATTQRGVPTFVNFVVDKTDEATNIAMQVYTKKFPDATVYAIHGNLWTGAKYASPEQVASALVKAGVPEGRPLVALSCQGDKFATVHRVGELMKSPQITFKHDMDIIGGINMPGFATRPNINWSIPMSSYSNITYRTGEASRFMGFRW